MTKHKVLRGNMVCFDGEWYRPDGDGFVYLPGLLVSTDVRAVTDAKKEPAAPEPIKKAEALDEKPAWPERTTRNGRA